METTHPTKKLDNTLGALIKNPALPFIGAIVSGLMLALAFPGVGQTSFAFVAFIPLMLALQGASAKKAALLGLIAGFAFFLISTFWLHNLTGKVPGMGLKFSALLGYVFLSLYCGLYFIPTALTTTACIKRWGIGTLRENIRMMFAITVVWVGSEYLRGILFTGFPWNPLGLSQYTNPAIIQIAEWGGVHIVSAAIIWFNVGMFITLRQYTHGIRTRKYRPHSELMIGLLPLAMSVSFGLHTLLNQARYPETIRVALIQPNIPQAEKWDKAKDQEIISTLEELTETASRVIGLDLIVWPETALPGFARRQSSPSHDLVTRMAKLGTPLLVGSMDSRITEDQRAYFNSSILFNERGNHVTTYDKQHLVPFGEYVPFPALTKKFTPVEVNFQKGTESTLMYLDGDYPFSPLICFEDIVAPLARKAVRSGASWLINQSNDAWFDPSAQSEQHFAHAVFRCVENRIAMARCCNSGVSGTIDPYGKMVKKLKPQTKGFTTAILTPRPANRPMTFYTRHGDIFAKVCLFAGTLVLFFLRPPRIKRAKKSDKKSVDSNDEKDEAPKPKKKRSKKPVVKIQSSLHKD